jgi:ribonuclease HII
MLLSQYTDDLTEAGCDEAGRGCLAGPVFAAAVILPRNYIHPDLDDSKKLTAQKRFALRADIEKDAVSWAVAEVSAAMIDEINILNASILAMHQAVDKLSCLPQLILVDGNRFKSYRTVPHQCIIRGDGLYLSIAAASILAKCYRDEYMCRLHSEFPVYDWVHNKGYGAKKHCDAIRDHGLTEHHRRSFRISIQLKFPF